MRIMTVDDIRQLLHKMTLKKFFELFMQRLEQDFLRWDDFKTIAPIATAFPAVSGAIELMPIADRDYYAFKWLNGYPHNFKIHKRNAVGLGALLDLKSGYPVLLSEMTILTALCQAATAALATKYLATPNTKNFGIIGTGAHSEFHALAHYFLFGMDSIYYFDTDVAAMDKFVKNIGELKLHLHRCVHAEEVIAHSETVVIGAPAPESFQGQTGSHFNLTGEAIVALGPQWFSRSKIIAGYTELSEVLRGLTPGRESSKEITLFDCADCSLGDYSVLRLVYQWAEALHVGHILDMIPDRGDVHDLYSLIKV